MWLVWNILWWMQWMKFGIKWWADEDIRHRRNAEDRNDWTPKRCSWWCCDPHIKSVSCLFWKLRSTSRARGFSQRIWESFSHGTEMECTATIIKIIPCSPQWSVSKHRRRTKRQRQFGISIPKRISRRKKVQKGPSEEKLRKPAPVNEFRKYCAFHTSCYCDITYCFVSLRYRIKSGMTIIFSFRRSGRWPGISKTRNILRYSLFCTHNILPSEKLPLLSETSSPTFASTKVMW